MPTVALGVIVGLVTMFSLFPYAGAFGTFGPGNVFSAFGNEALIAICALMILGRSLLLTGALEPAARLIAKLWSVSPLITMLLTLIMCAGLSGVLNNTPLMIVMIAVITSVATRTKMSPSKFLMPMNYSALIGGMGTTIGSSTNVIVVSIASELGASRIGVFDFVHLTLIAFVPALLFLWLIAPRFLHDREVKTPGQGLQLFDAWLYVPDDSDLVGKPLKDLLEKSPSRPRVLEIKRGDNIYLMRLPSLKIEAGDRLLVRDTRTNLKLISDDLKLPLHDLGDDDLPDYHQLEEEVVSHHMAELVVSPSSSLAGSTVGHERFAERMGLIVLGLRKLSAPVSTKSEEIRDAVVHAGDVLLVQGPQSALESVKSTGDFLVLDGAMSLPRNKKALTALAIMFAVVLLAATQVLPISIAAILGVLALLFTSCMKWEDVGQSLNTEVILIVAASLALGSALTATGGAEFLATEYVSAVSSFSPAVILSSLMLLIAILTNFVSNNAAAAVGTPIGISIASQLGVSAEPFVLAVLFGANLCYLTPMGYQTNLLIMGAARYQFKDFVKTGTPLLLIMWGMYSWLLPKFFPL